ncbi:hypothetical protein BP5796_07572 [Coleophoma crateriformis]|uniref:Major facilitator superfamily (MFS) profile domain-containing protein n=1 Tax=Coleophoma crateriformis TaxID=565419 RepID=A0A3D8RJH3_9HELO|nr:hypothetical protein BP5796_07572 [Coleophoma crateriformis]
MATPFPSDGTESRSVPGNTYEPVTRGRDIESQAGTEDGGDGIDVAEKGAQENDCTLVRSFTPGNRQLDIEPPPDGGMQAWLQVLMGHLVIFNSFGYTNSYGFFESYYTSELGLTASTLSWPGSIQIFLAFLVGTVSGRACDAGYLRSVLALGFAFQLLSVFSTSFCTQYWQILLAQGICQGLGNGLSFTPAVSTVATYFLKRRALAIALVSCGNATGGVVFPLLAQQLIPRIGFGWTLRVMGFVMLFNMVIVLSIAKNRLPPRTSGPLIDMTAFKDVAWVLFVISTFLMFWVLFFAITYINLYGTNIIGVSHSTSTNILLILNAVGVPGRVIPCLISDYYLGPINTVVPLACICSLLFFLWQTVHTYGGLIGFAIAFGFINTGVQVLATTSMSSLCRDVSKMGTRVGMALTILSFATLTGGPIAGALIDADHGNFLYAQIFGGVVIAVGTVVLVGARISQTGLHIMVRM